MIVLGPSHVFVHEGLFFSGAAVVTFGNVADRKAAWVAVAKALAGAEAPRKPTTSEVRFIVEPRSP